MWPWFRLDGPGTKEETEMLTKPAGVFLQLLAIPVMLVGCLDGMDAAHDGTGGAFGWSVFAIGLAMLLIGRRPAVRKD